MRNLETLSQLTSELDQHLTQVSALIDFMSVDYCNNENEFTVNPEIVGNLLWTAQTLLNNAKKSANQLYEFNREAYLQECVAQTVKGGSDE